MQEPGLNNRSGTIMEAFIINGVAFYQVRLPPGVGNPAERWLKVKATKVEAMSPLWDLDITAVHSQLRWGEVEQKLIFIDSEGQHREFRLELPLNFPLGNDAERVGTEATAWREWPLLLYFHGAGGESFYGNTKKSLHSAGLQYAAANFVVVSPMCSWDYRQIPGSWVNELVQTLRASEWIDDKRIYATGQSTGGMSTLEVSAARPDLYAAIAPVAAWHREERTEQIAEQLCRTPVLAIHSSKDETSPKAVEEPLWEALQRIGDHYDGSLLQVELGDHSHCSMFERAFCDDVFVYEWLLRFVKNS